MEYLIHNFGLALTVIIIVSIVFIRYLLFAGIPYLYLYKLNRKKFSHKRIQKIFPKVIVIKNEIKNSFVTALIFAFFGLVIYYLKVENFTQIYTDINTYGMGYFFASIFIMLLLHDTYFYWMHRAVHHKKLYLIFHKTHHNSRQPTPFASFSFDIAEAFAEFLIFPIIILLLPVHPIALFIVFNFSLLFNVLGHLGYEFLPVWFVKHPVLKWINTSTHHNMHHQRANANYGLYFNFWDTWMGTNHKNYIKRFTEITTQVEQDFTFNT